MGDDNNPGSGAQKPAETAPRESAKKPKGLAEIALTILNEIFRKEDHLAFLERIREAYNRLEAEKGTEEDRKLVTKELETQLAKVDTEYGSVPDLARNYYRKLLLKVEDQSDMA